MQIQNNFDFQPGGMPLFKPGHEEGRPPTKKQRILDLHAAGITDIVELARRVQTTTSYVAAVLTEAGLLRGYYDLYTTSARPMNYYGRLFQGILSFKNEASALDSVERIDKLYHYFEEQGDRAGQHHAMLVALTGRNRALGIGKVDEARIFSRWLIEHLQIQESPAAEEPVVEENSY